MASRYGKKVYSAVRYARRKHWDAAVVLIDRDGRRNSHRLSDMQEGRSQVTLRFPCALGVAVETFDAWMIADPIAIDAAGGDKTEAPDSPESLGRPKDAADAIFGTRSGSGLGPKYALVAKKVNLALLERACPQGFAPFAEEVRGRVGPVVSRHAN